MGHYFITVPTQQKTIRMGYDSLMLESSAKERVGFLGKIKKRFSRGEVEGVLGKIVEKEKEDIGELVGKYFRKVGKEY